MVFAAVVVSAPPQALPQESPSINAEVLKKYFEPKSLSQLEWELMKANAF